MQTKNKILLGIGVLVVGYLIYRKKKIQKPNTPNKPNKPNTPNTPNTPQKSGMDDIFTINKNTNTPSSSEIEKEMADCKRKKGTWQPSSGGGFCQTWIKPQQTNTTIQPPPRINIGFPSGGGSNTLPTNINGNGYDNEYNLPTDSSY